jgi:hypothetical protein
VEGWAQQSVQAEKARGKRAALGLSFFSMISARVMYVEAGTPDAVCTWGAALAPLPSSSQRPVASHSRDRVAMRNMHCDMFERTYVQCEQHAANARATSALQLHPASEAAEAAEETASSASRFDRKQNLADEPSAGVDRGFAFHKVQNAPPTCYLRGVSVPRV